MPDKKDDGAYELRKVLEEMELELVQSLRRNMKRHEKEEEKESFRWEMWQRAKLRNMQRYRKENKTIVGNVSPEVERIVNEALEENYQKGKNLFSRIWDKIKSIFFKRKRVRFPEDISHHKITAPPPLEDNFFGVNTNKINALQEEAEKAQTKMHTASNKELYRPEGKEKWLSGATNDSKLEDMKQKVVQDLKGAQKAALRRMDDIYRQTIYRAEMNMAAGAKTLDQAIDMATKEFLNAGIDCIEYKNGRRVNIASYAEMALRTASQRAVLLGEGKKRDEWGIHTVVVSAHANTCPLCAPWQGKLLVDDVFSHGTVEEAKELGYPLLSDAMKAGLLHPNCRHTISTYFPGITKLPEIPDSEKAAEIYKVEQKQREFERKIRKWKRIAVGSMEPEKVNLANDRVRKYQGELREYLEEHVELRRDFTREKTRGLTETLKADVNESRADKMFYVVLPVKGDAIKPHSLFKALNKSQVGKEAIEYIESNAVNVEISYSDEIGLGLRGRTFGHHIEIYAGNTRSIKETAKAIVHEVTHMRYGIGGDRWSEVVCTLKELEHEKGLLTVGDKRNTIKLIKKLYPELPWRKKG